MLRVKDTLSQSAFRTGRAIRLNLTNDKNPLHRFPATVYTHDLFFRLLASNRFYIDYGFESISQLCRFDTISKESDDFVTFPVSSVRYTSWRQEADTYRNFSKNLQLFANFLGFGVGETPSPRKESECDHATFSGYASRSSTDIDHTTSNTYVISGYTPLRRNDYFRRQGYVTSVYPLRFVFDNEVQGDVLLYNIDSFVQSIIDAGYIRFIDYGFQVHTVSNIEVEKNDLVYVLTYHTEIQTPSVANCNMGLDICQWDSRISFPLGGGSYDHISPQIGPLFYTRTYPAGTFEYYNGTRTTDGSGCGWEAEGDMEGSFPNDPTYVTISLALSANDGYSEVEHGRIPDIALAMSSSSDPSKLMDRIRADWKNISPSSFYSSVEAFKDLEGSLDVNILQNIQKLPALLDSIPDVLGLLKSVGKLVSLDLTTETLRGVLDKLSSEKLKYDFSIRPTLDVLNKYLPKLGDVIDLFAMNKSLKNGYGVFRYTFPSGTYYRSTLRLLTKTKMVFDSSFHGLLSSLVGLDAIGVIPKVSNLADLIPMSFLLNWFTGILSAIRRAEYSVFLITLPAYYVHSYTFVSPLETSELQKFSISSAMPNTEDPSIRVYIREVTSFSPLPGNSRHNFGGPPGVPSLVTFGALLYQLLLA